MPPTLRKEATQLIFNDHTAWMTKFSLRELRDLFNDRKIRTRDNPSSTLSRPIVPSHQTTIEKYLVENPDWAFDTITLATPQGSITKASKMIMFDADHVIILDGQHRVNAILSFLRQLDRTAPADRSNRTQNRLNALLRDEVPCLICEVTTPQHQKLLFQLFSKRLPFNPADPAQNPFDPAHAAASTKDTTDDITEDITHLPQGQPQPTHPSADSPNPVQDSVQEPLTRPQPRWKFSLSSLKNLVPPLSSTPGQAQGDQHRNTPSNTPDNKPHNPFDTAAAAAIQRSTLLINRINTGRKTQGNTTPILTFANLKDLAITIQLGIARTPNADDLAACNQPKHQAALQNQIVTFFDKFLPLCQPNYQVLQEPRNLDDLIVASRSHSYALEPPVIRLLANAWARWVIDYQLEPEALATHVGNLKMAKADPFNDIETSFALVQGQKKKFHNHSHPTWEKATALIIQNASSQSEHTPQTPATLSVPDLFTGADTIEKPPT